MSNLEKFMSSKWLILAIVVLIYLPVSIDATVLHVATPTLIESLSLSANQLLWIIDIYSLVMAGLILPMGALGDRIGFKKLMIIGGILFGLASLAAAFSTTAWALIGSRALLAVGAAMICLRLYLRFAILFLMKNNVISL
jgi:DHA2 family multidrug resistance protein-like MFS transporter